MHGMNFVLICVEECALLAKLHKIKSVPRDIVSRSISDGGSGRMELDGRGRLLKLIHFGLWFLALIKGPRMFDKRGPSVSIDINNRRS